MTGSWRGKLKRRSLFTLAAGLVALSGCGPRVLIVTGTTIGLKATPGDASTRPPQVTLAYKRAETALVPTKGDNATKDSDAFSTLASFFFTSKWFGDTEIASFIATGEAAKLIQADGSEFTTAFAETTLGVVPDDIQARRVKLAEASGGLDDTQSQRVLDLAGYPKKVNETAKDSLLDAIKDAQTEALLQKLESAFQRVR